MDIKERPWKGSNVLVPPCAVYEPEKWQAMLRDHKVDEDRPLDLDNSTFLIQISDNIVQYRSKCPNVTIPKFATFFIAALQIEPNGEVTKIRAFTRPIEWGQFIFGFADGEKELSKQKGWDIRKVKWFFVATVSGVPTCGIPVHFTPVVFDESIATKATYDKQISDFCSYLGYLCTEKKYMETLNMWMGTHKSPKKSKKNKDSTGGINDPSSVAFMKHKSPEVEEVGYIEYRPYKANFNGYKTMEEAVKHGHDLSTCTFSSATTRAEIVHVLTLSNTYLAYLTRTSCCQEAKIILSIPVGDIGLEFAKKLRSVVIKIEILRKLAIEGKFDDDWNTLHAEIDRDRMEIMEQFIEDHNL